MHRLTDPAIDQYCTEHSTPESELLYRLNRQTHLQTELPVMLSGHLQGRVLSMISHMIKPKTILEIGTFTGYSALCLAEGLQPDGKLYTIDNHEEQTELARDFVAQSAYAHQIIFKIGKAADILPQLTENFDLVFIDADKINYGLYYDLVIDRVNTGGYILSDNVLYHGDVVALETAGKNALAMHAFNQKIKQDNRLENVLLPIRDGIMLSRKK
ncbi:MAG: class I SAM-dependent methyltransferase [Chitinophagaceae bacterium]|nr:class I SAM-dependent methyltransferase [Chitinophagaceae bacterium]